MVVSPNGFSKIGSWRFDGIEPFPQFVITFISQNFFNLMNSFGNFANSCQRLPEAFSHNFFSKSTFRLDVD